MRLLCLAIVVLLGLTRIAYPFFGDQALFTVGAMQLHDGGVLYRDFWDVKQPGIYMFYLAAGSLFGFSPVGIHAFELLYWLLFSILLQRTLYQLSGSPLASAAAPVFAVGIYYANATSHDLTQVEAIVGFPLYLAMYFALAGARKPSRGTGWFAAAGVCGALVLYFKLMFLPMLLLLWVALLYGAARSRAPDERAGILRGAAVLAVVFAAATAAWIVFTIERAGANVVLATFFIYPVEVVRLLPPAPFIRLLAGLVTYAAHVAPLLMLASVSFFVRRRVWRDPVWTACAAWVAGALLVILLQRLSWWPYQMQLLNVPLGVLAAFGLQDLWALLRNNRDVSIAVLSIVLLVAFLAAPIKHTVTAVLALQRFGFALSDQGRAQFQRSVDPNDPSPVETTFLRKPDALPGAIYVCGDPRYYIAANREQRLSITGWALELLLPAQWRQLQAELAQRRPSYIFVDSFYRRLIPERSPAFAAEIRARYRMIHHDLAGDWYRLESGIAMPRASARRPYHASWARAERETS